MDNSNLNIRSPTPPIKTSKSMLDYMWMAGRVMKDKTWYTMWHFDLHETVDRVYPGESYYESVKALMTKEASHICDHLYVGSAFNAADYNWLKKNEIDIIVNVTPSIGNYFPKDFEYHTYQTPDLRHGSLRPYYEKFYSLVLNNPGKKIFIHCFAGKSRSASLVLYYLMKKNGLNLDNAINYLKSRRPAININCKFIEEICLELGAPIDRIEGTCPFCESKHE